jgi:hypothetical protein
VAGSVSGSGGFPVTEVGTAQPLKAHATMANNNVNSGTLVYVLPFITIGILPDHPVGYGL